MTLLELCEPLFLKVCELNRMARCGMSQDFSEVRGELGALLEGIQKQSAADIRLARQAKEMQLPLVFFVDSMITSGQLPFAAKWRAKRLAEEQFNELAGDDVFFDLLKKTLEDPSKEAEERLIVYHAMLGLGFVGSRVGQPEEIRRCMAQIGARIRPHLDVDYKSRLCPEAYEQVDETDLTEPPNRKVTVLAIVCACAILSTLFFYNKMYASAIQTIDESVTKILDWEATVRTPRN